MYVQTSVMTTGKSEHTEAMIEDAALCDALRGIFAVSDGNGTMLFSRQWAHTLVQHIGNVPLVYNDPFEVDWWLSLAQNTHKKQIPPVTSTDRNIQKKGREGSAATLAVLNITSLQANETATAQLLAIGDSCIFIANAATGAVRAFPLEEATDFDRAPICLSSIQRKFNRSFHCLLSTQVELRPQDCVVIVTDAVARWIIAHRGRTLMSALQEVVKQTPDTWNRFIVECRSLGEMVDDDATAIVIQLNDKRMGLPLAIVPAHAKAVVDQRREDFINALREQDKEKMAILYGAGQDFRGYKIKNMPSIEDARTVGDAINEIRQTFLSAFNRSDIQDRTERAWKKHEDLLQQPENRASIEALLNMLASGGVLPEAAAHLPPNIAQEHPISPSKDWLISTLMSIVEYLKSAMIGGGGQ